MAEVLARRGTRAMLFRGEDGLDELTTTGPSTVFDVRDGRVHETHLDPAELGLARARPSTTCRAAMPPARPRSSGRSSPASRARAATSWC